MEERKRKSEKKAKTDHEGTFKLRKHHWGMREKGPKTGNRGVSQGQVKKTQKKTGIERD